MEYWKGNGPKPTVDEATDGLFGMAEDLSLEKTTLRPGVVAALFSPDFGVVNVPFAEHTIPGVIAASDYDIGNNEVSYFDTEYKRVSGNDNQNTGNSGWSYRNDGVDLESSDDPQVEYNVGWTDDGEWLEYTVEVTTTGKYEMTARTASGTSGGRIAILMDGVSAAPSTTIPNSGGYQQWKKVELGETNLQAGTHIMRVEIVTGGFNLSIIEFELIEN